MNKRRMILAALLVPFTRIIRAQDDRIGLVIADKNTEYSDFLIEVTNETKATNKYMITVRADGREVKFTAKEVMDILLDPTDYGFGVKHEIKEVK